MGKYDFVYKPYVLKAAEVKDFPFSLIKKEATENEKEIETFEILNEESEKEKLNTEIKNFLINNYNFNRPDQSSFVIKINIVNLEEKKKKVVNSIKVKVKAIPTNYDYVLIKSIDQLKNVLKDVKKIAFDTETTGLNHETDYMVGYSFSLGNKKGYYVPVKHSVRYNEFNLGNEAIDILYEALVKAELVYMFNSRFDMRVMEYTDKKYDMSKIKLRDVQVSAWFADPDNRKHSLKELEKHFLGYYRPDFMQVLKNAKSTSAAETYNIGLISPENVLFYAAQDALSTFELGEEAEKYYIEFKKSAKIDMHLLYPLMKMENHGIRINTLYLEEQMLYIMPRLKEIDDNLKNNLVNINLNSPKQKAELFKSLGLDTGKKSPKTNQMSTGIKDIEDMIGNLEKKGKANSIPKWLYDLSERSKLEKLQSTFFGSLLEQAKLNNGRVRINYRNTQAATGRLSSGASFDD